MTTKEEKYWLLKQKNVLIKQNISVNIEKKNDKFYCYDRTALILLMGTSSVDIHMYKGLKKDKVNGSNVWIVPLNIVLERIKFMEQQLQSLNNRLDITRQFGEI